jgi:hypothetical protein
MDRMKSRLDRGVFVAGALLAINGCASPEAPISTEPAASALGTRNFGTYCAQDFQNTWQAALPDSWDRCSGFNGRMDDFASQAFYYDLNGTKPYYENTLDEYEPETADILFVNTHGGAWADTATQTMWNQNERAFSKDMRFGDESKGLSILSSYSCHTLQTDNVWGRWYNAFAGGLLMVTGSHDLLFSGSTTDEVGEDYADYIAGAFSIKNSWRYGLGDWWTDQDIAIATTGSNSTDCWNRMEGLVWATVPTTNRLRDGQIGYMCWTWFDNE